MILLSTGSLYNYGLARVFAMAAEAGFDGVEVLVDGRWDSRDPSYLKRLSQEHGLPIAVLHSPFVPGIQGWPAGQLRRLERTVALAGASTTTDLTQTTICSDISSFLPPKHTPCNDHAMDLRCTFIDPRNPGIPVIPFYGIGL